MGLGGHSENQLLTTAESFDAMTSLMLVTGAVGDQQELVLQVEILGKPKISYFVTRMAFLIDFYRRAVATRWELRWLLKCCANNDLK